MKIELTQDEVRVFLGFIDTTLKAKGIEALDAAWTFKYKIQQAAQQEQNEKILSPDALNRCHSTNGGESVPAPQEVGLRSS